MIENNSVLTGELLGGLKLLTLSIFIVGSAITFVNASRNLAGSSPGNRRISKLQVAALGITFVCLLPFNIVSEMVFLIRKLYSRSFVSSLTKSGSFNDSRILANFACHSGFCKAATSLKNFSTAGSKLIGVCQSSIRFIARTRRFGAESAIGCE